MYGKVISFKGLCSLELSAMKSIIRSMLQCYMHMHMRCNAIDYTHTAHCAKLCNLIEVRYLCHPRSYPSNAQTKDPSGHSDQQTVLPMPQQPRHFNRWEHSSSDLSSARGSIKHFSAFWQETTRPMFDYTDN